MNFETKAIHGIRTSGDKVWNNLNMDECPTQHEKNLKHL